jgi:MinD-like ATPase involved in chromosome partitioning or flagellar assembly
MTNDQWGSWKNEQLNCIFIGHRSLVIGHSFLEHLFHSKPSHPMSDQADHLRHLVLRAARQRDAEALPPRIVAVAQANRGMGSTTICAHLGRALVESGARVVLIDADPNTANLARRCEVQVPVTYRAAIARQDIHESLLRAPGGLQLVPGVWDDTASPTERIQQQLLRQFQQLGRHADWLVLDLGVPRSEVLRTWRDAIETFLLVTTPDGASVMDTYTFIKQSLVARAGRGIELLVNRADSARMAGDVFDRVDRSCQRFLGFGVQLAGHVPPHGNADSLAAVATRLCDEHSAISDRRAA